MAPERAEDVLPRSDARRPGECLAAAGVHAAVSRRTLWQWRGKVRYYTNDSSASAVACGSLTSAMWLAGISR
jgi:hypothetical protein